MLPGNTIGDLVLTSFPGFRVDTVAVMSYSDEGQVPAVFSGSVLAHGVIDNMRVTMPPEPISNVVGGVQNGRWHVEFESHPGWTYRLEATGDFQNWTTVDQVQGNGEFVVLEDELSGSESSFYRVEAWKP